MTGAGHREIPRIENRGVLVEIRKRCVATHKCSRNFALGIPKAVEGFRTAQGVLKDMGLE